MSAEPTDAESQRLSEDARRERNWKRWGPYLSERQWGTVREDYSADGSAWEYLPHDHARSRAYRWGEDGLLGITDREERLCFAVALWNEQDPILKERLFGLTGREGNHGEDVKECYWYLDATPTGSYLKALYRYPQAAFPYARLVEENRRRTRDDPEFEITDTGVFADNRWFDVTAEYAKAGPDDILIRLSVRNCGPAAARLHLLPTLWFRNTWAWGRTGEGYWPRPRIELEPGGAVLTDHMTLPPMRLTAGRSPSGAAPEWLFTENETNCRRLFGAPDAAPCVKDAFHERVIHQDHAAVGATGAGTKAAAWYRLTLEAGQEQSVTLRLSAADGPAEPVEGPAFDGVFARRLAEADAFFAARLPPELDDEERRVARQAVAGLLWSRQFYHYVVRQWLEGDPGQPPPPAERLKGRNADWRHLYNRDVISMPDKWEYPWYASWDLAFHMIPFARIDPAYTKEQLVLLLREWYMHANGALPAYEFALADANPPVHAWACWRAYKMTAPRGGRDRIFLSRVFQKLLINFTWWVNRKDLDGNNIFTGGFLGLDNIGVFDRSKPLPTGGSLQQADGTAWMAFYCATMLSMALELAQDNPATEDVASKFFEHFVAIADAMNTFGGSGLWDEEDGFYYDQLQVDGRQFPLRIRSMVGIIPLFTCELLEQEVIDRLPGFSKRLNWFLENRSDLAGHISYMTRPDAGGHTHRLLAIPTPGRLGRVLRRLLDENEFLSPWGIRSVSKYHEDHPYVLRFDGQEYRVGYDPGESTSGLFGGNSNWRGPVWFPLNFLLIEALERYDHFYGDAFRVECPVGSGRMMTLGEVAGEIASRLASIFLPDASGRRPFFGPDDPRGGDAAWKDLLLFHEYFHGDTGRGLGAGHQTGWTALVLNCLADRARSRAGARP